MRSWGLMAAGFAAGFVTGLFGGGGGMVLIPLLTLVSALSEKEIFPASISIILPVCVVSLLFSTANGQVFWLEAIPYLAGSALGGIAAGKWGRYIPVKWLHRGLGILILWGGIRYLC